MDHRFYFDPLSDSYEAKLDDELQVVGFWLSSEIGRSRAALERAQALIGQALAEPQRELQLRGHQYSLLLSQGEVSVRANGCDAPADLSLFEDDGLELYLSESEAWCGAEDLLELLQAWQAFVPLR